jgi:orotidine-5'-phosphate decarboxylase
MDVAKKQSTISTNYPDIFTIADAKRGDIGNTSSMYAKAFFEDLNFDRLLLPLYGKDSVEPFLVLKTNIPLCLP